MLQDNHRSRAIGFLLLLVTLCLVLLAACNPINKSSGNANNGTAIAVVVQTVNAGATSVSKSPTASPGANGESYERIIRFSGQEWNVKSSNMSVGPGPNYFSNSAESVWVDERGQLHLKLIRKDGRWYCAEVVTRESLGYGSYQFKISSRTEILDKYVVLGLFTWDTTAPQFNYREIDIELSKWGEDADLNAQFVVQPWDRSGHRHRFAIDPQADTSTHIFVWSPKHVEFLSFLGGTQSPDSNNIVAQWSYTSTGIPPAGSNTNTRVNLWLIGGHPPSNGKEIEVVISSFDFIPQAPTK
jgi:hypothetical protein